ncbi:MAG: winged helix-turn-helix domain-containing protein, partial [Mycobacteriales bacterium]
MPTAPSPRRVAPESARRLAVTAQGLADRPPATPHRGDIFNLVRRIGCLQLDPTNVVARSHLLVLWSRLGRYDVTEVAALVEQDRALFEYWAHAASLVLSEDWPIHHLRMRTYARGDGVWARRVGDWVAANAALRQHILRELRRRGPLQASELEDQSDVSWRSSGWTNERNVGRMLDFLSVQGKALVAARRGGRRLWDLAERCVPREYRQQRLSDSEAVRRATMRAVRCLGIARARDIPHHFTSGLYPGLPRVLRALEQSGDLIACAVDGLPDTWYVHAADETTLDALERGDWHPRTTLLSPFDNLIRDRERTEMLWGFRFRLEIYTPPAKREFGYFVLPVLDGDELVGRADAARDRARGVL